MFVIFVYLNFSLYTWIISYIGVLVEDRQKKCPFKICQASLLKGNSVLVLLENVPLPSAALGVLTGQKCLLSLMELRVFCV